MPYNYVVSQRVNPSNDGRVYVPECIRQMISSTLCARVEERAEFGKCIAFYMRLHCKKGGEDVHISPDGYIDISRICKNAGIAFPSIWRASTNTSRVLEELLLHYDDNAGSR